MYFYMLLSCEVKQGIQPLKKGLETRRKKKKNPLLGNEGVLSLGNTHVEPILKSLFILSKEILKYNKDCQVLKKKQTVS